jgi:hypothetical protein
METARSLRLVTTARLLFVAAVTCYLLSRLYAAPASPAEVVIYSGTAAFGMEFLVASWQGLWRRA